MGDCSPDNQCGRPRLFRRAHVQLPPTNCPPENSGYPATGSSSPCNNVILPNGVKLDGHSATQAMMDATTAKLAGERSKASNVFRLIGDKLYDSSGKEIAKASVKYAACDHYNEYGQRVRARSEANLEGAKILANTGVLATPDYEPNFNFELSLHTGNRPMPMGDYDKATGTWTITMPSGQRVSGIKIEVGLREGERLGFDRSGKTSVLYDDSVHRATGCYHDSRGCDAKAIPGKGELDISRELAAKISTGAKTGEKLAVVNGKEFTVTGRADGVVELVDANGAAARIVHSTNKDGTLNATLYRRVHAFNGSYNMDNSSNASAVWMKDSELRVRVDTAAPPTAQPKSTTPTVDKLPDGGKDNVKPDNSKLPNGGGDPKKFDTAGKLPDGGKDNVKPDTSKLLNGGSDPTKVNAGSKLPDGGKGNVKPDNSKLPNGGVDPTKVTAGSKLPDGGNNNTATGSTKLPDGGVDPTKVDTGSKLPDGGNNNTTGSTKLPDGGANTKKVNAAGNLTDGGVNPPTPGPGAKTTAFGISAETRTWMNTQTEAILAYHISKLVGDKKEVTFGVIGKNLMIDTPTYKFAPFTDSSLRFYSTTTNSWMNPEAKAEPLTNPRKSTGLFHIGMLTLEQDKAVEAVGVRLEGTGDDRLIVATLKLKTGKSFLMKFNSGRQNTVWVAEGADTPPWAADFCKDINSWSDNLPAGR